MERAVYDETFPARLLASIRVAQRRARTRLLSAAHVSDIMRAVAEYRAGHAAAHGGRVTVAYARPAHSSELNVWWYTWRRTKVVVWRVERDIAYVVKPGSYCGPCCQICTDEEWRIAAYIVIHPERHRRWQHLRCLHTIRRLGAVAPNTDMVEVVEANERLRIAAVLSEDGIVLLCCPVGAFRLPWRCGAIAPMLGPAVYEVANVRLSQLPDDASWGDLEPHFLMAALSGVGA